MLGLNATATPVPFRVTGEPVMVTVLLLVKLTVNELVRGPLSAEVGANRMLIVQAAPGARLWFAVQVPPVRENGAAGVVQLRPVRVWLPVLVTVRFWVEFEPLTTLPKFRGDGETVAVYAGGDTTSIAPASTFRLVGVFLGVPK